MQSKAATVEEYLSELPEDRRTALAAVRKVMLENLDRDFDEGMQYGMIGYFVPHRVYPAGYHCDPKQPLPFACLASQKNHMSLYLMCVYGDSVEAKRFQDAWAKTGKKLDMGKSCIRFKKVDDLALDVIADTIRRFTAAKYISVCESVIKNVGKSKPKAASQPSGSKKVAAKATAKKAVKKPAAAKTLKGTMAAKGKSSAKSHRAR